MSCQLGTVILLLGIGFILSASGCVPGTWGSNCSETCNCAAEQEVCDEVNGHCPSGCNEEFGGVSCNLVLPSLQSITVNVSTGSEHTLVVSFPAWAAGNESGSKPTGYNVQHRFSWNGHWINGVEIEHDSIIQQYRTQLENLDPDNTYYVRVIPFLNDGGIAYYGIPTSERGPFSTIAVASGGPGKTDRSGVIAGVIIALILVALLADIVVILVRKQWLSRRSRASILYRAENGSRNDRNGIINDAETGMNENGYEIPTSITARNSTTRTSGSHDTRRVNNTLRDEQVVGKQNDPEAGFSNQKNYDVEMSPQLPVSEKQVAVPCGAGETVQSRENNSKPTIMGTDLSRLVNRETVEECYQLSLGLESGNGVNHPQERIGKGNVFSQGAGIYEDMVDSRRAQGSGVTQTPLDSENPEVNRGARHLNNVTEGGVPYEDVRRYEDMTGSQLALSKILNNNCHMQRVGEEEASQGGDVYEVMTNDQVSSRKDPLHADNCHKERVHAEETFNPGGDVYEVMPSGQLPTGNDLVNGDICQRETMGDEETFNPGGDVYEVMTSGQMSTRKDSVNRDSYVKKGMDQAVTLYPDNIIYDDVVEDTPIHDKNIRVKPDNTVNDFSKPKIPEKGKAGSQLPTAEVGIDQEISSNDDICDDFIYDTPQHAQKFSTKPINSSPELPGKNLMGKEDSVPFGMGENGSFNMSDDTYDVPRLLLETEGPGFELPVPNGSMDEDEAFHQNNDICDDVIYDTPQHGQDVNINRSSPELPQLNMEEKEENGNRFFVRALVENGDNASLIQDDDIYDVPKMLTENEEVSIQSPVPKEQIYDDAMEMQISASEEAVLRTNDDTFDAVVDNTPVIETPETAEGLIQDDDIYDVPKLHAEKEEVAIHSPVSNEQTYVDDTEKQISTNRDVSRKNNDTFDEVVETAPVTETPETSESLIQDDDIYDVPKLRTEKEVGIPLPASKEQMYEDATKRQISVNGNVSPQNNDNFGEVIEATPEHGQTLSSSENDAVVDFTNRKNEEKDTHIPETNANVDGQVELYEDQNIYENVVVENTSNV